MSARACQVAAGLALVAAGCGAGGGDAPVFDPVGDRIAYAGAELRLELRASTVTGTAIDYRVDSSHPPLAGAELRLYPGGGAVLGWLPGSDDVGVHRLDLIAEADGQSAIETIAIDVQPSPRDGPVILEPLASGRLFDPATAPDGCLALDIEVAADVRDVDIAVQPELEGAALERAEEAPTATWRWCPTSLQREGRARHDIMITATDAGGATSTRAFAIVLDRPPGKTCPGARPVIDHQAQAIESAGAVAIEARIRDVEGLRDPPLVCWSTEPMTDTELCARDAVTMQVVGGDQRDGSWRATLPSPLAAADTATLHYAVLAIDDDDEIGTCDNRTLARFEAAVTRPRSPALGICEPCQLDAECGGDADHCLPIAARGSACGRACDAPGERDDCPDGTYCSFFELESVGGVSSHQCLPDGALCGVAVAPAPACERDRFEPNDTFGAAAAITAGETAAQMCTDPALAAGESDYFAIDVAATSRVSIATSGPDEVDLDLLLGDPQGVELLRLSAGVGSDERVEACLPAGRYPVLIYGYRAPGAGGVPYTIDIDIAAGGCEPICPPDDSAEPDSDFDTARPVTDLATGYHVDGAILCGPDEDWFELELAAGETIHASLVFDMTTPREDLDIHLFGPDPDTGEPDLLAPCYEHPVNDCDPDRNGQSYDSNERFVWTADVSGTYWLRIYGWDDSQNRYDLCISTVESACPAP